MPVKFKYKLDGTPTLRYLRSVEHRVEEENIKSAHRNIIFGNSPDVTMKPQLNKTGEQE